MRTYLPIIILLWLLCMLISLYDGVLDCFFWAAQHAHVQGIDYFALPKSFLNLRMHHSMYDSWHGIAFGPYATWYLAHPMFSLLIMPWFAWLSPWASYTAFVCFSLGLMIYCGFLFAKETCVQEERVYYYAFFLLGFPLYWMLYVGNMHALLVYAMTLILIGLYRLYHDPHPHRISRPLFLGLLISLFTKPITLILLPVFLGMRETRRTSLWALVIYSIASWTVLSFKIVNPESLSWHARWDILRNISWIQDTMNIYKNHYTLTAPMKDNAVHWFNLIAQTGYRFYHVENFSCPVFIDMLLQRTIPSIIFFIPILICLGFSCCLPWIKNTTQRGHALILLVMLVITSFFISYNSVWEYQYTAMFPVVAMLYFMRHDEIFTRRQGCMFAILSLFLYLPSPYILLNNAAITLMTMSLIKCTRVFAVLVIFIMLTYRLMMILGSNVVFGFKKNRTAIVVPLC